MSDKLRILHLEDNAEDVALVRETIAAQGIDAAIVDVETQADFINALEKEDYDLVLADYTLPSFDGLSALAIARVKFPLLPFIFVTGTMGEEKAVDVGLTGNMLGSSVLVWCKIPPAPGYHLPR